MELLVGLAVFVLFDIAAWRWGVDSISPVQEDISRVIKPRPTRAI